MFQVSIASHHIKIFGIIASVSFLMGFYQPKLSFWRK